MEQSINEYERNTLPIRGHTNTITTDTLADSKGKTKKEHIPTTRQISHRYYGLGKPIALIKSANMVTLWTRATICCLKLTHFR